MRSYKYDGLLSTHFSKSAASVVRRAVGFAARNGANAALGVASGGMFGGTVGGLAAAAPQVIGMYNNIKGTLEPKESSLRQSLGNYAKFAGVLTSGARLAAKAGLGVATGGMLGGTVGNLAASAGQFGDIYDYIDRGPRTKSGSRTVTASLREKRNNYTLKRASSSWKDVVSPISYAAMLAGSLSNNVIDPHEHPIASAVAHYGLEGAGLAGLLATTGHDYFGEPKKKRDWRNLADLAALATFAGVNAHRAYSPPAH